MGVQLQIELFIKKTLLPKRLQAQVRRMVRRAKRLMSPRPVSYQYEINFNPVPKGLSETYLQYDRKTGRFVKLTRIIDFTPKKHGKVGSPVRAKKVLKDEPYSTGLL